MDPDHVVNGGIQQELMQTELTMAIMVLAILVLNSLRVAYVIHNVLTIMWKSIFKTTIYFELVTCQLKGLGTSVKMLTSS